MGPRVAISARQQPEQVFFICYQPEVELQLLPQWTRPKSQTADVPSPDPLVLLTVRLPDLLHIYTVHALPEHLPVSTLSVLYQLH